MGDNINFYLNKTIKMNKQKAIFLLSLSVFIISLAGCTKSTSNNIENDDSIWNNDITNQDNSGINNEWENKKDTDSPLKTEKIDETYEYQNKPYNFTIQIPNNWSFIENEHGFTVLVYTPENGDIHENLWITVQTPQIATDLEDYYKDSMKRIAEISEWFKEIKTSDIEINWLKGKSTIYETIKNGIGIKSQQSVFIDDKNYVYILQYTATKDTFDKYMDGINTIINSFKILN